MGLGKYLRIVVDKDIMKRLYFGKFYVTVEKKSLVSVLKQFGSEAMICSIPHSQKKRLDVYRLLAREFF